MEIWFKILHFTVVNKIKLISNIINKIDNYNELFS